MVPSFLFYSRLFISYDTYEYKHLKLLGRFFRGQPVQDHPGQNPASNNPDQVQKIDRFIFVDHLFCSWRAESWFLLIHTLFLHQHEGGIPNIFQDSSLIQRLIPASSIFFLFKDHPLYVPQSFLTVLPDFNRLFQSFPHLFLHFRVLEQLQDLFQNI